MNKTFKGYLKKEAIEGVRTNKYLILFLGTVFWALIDPLMLRLLPVILGSSMPVDMSGLVPEFTRSSAFENFVGDFFEISTLFFCFTLMGIIANELRSKKLVFPYSSGARPPAIVLAKYFHYAFTFSSLILLSFLTNFLYITLLFEEGTLKPATVLSSAALYILYYCFLLSLLILLSSLFKRGIVPGILTILFAYTMNIINQFTDINRYFPNYLVYKARVMIGIFDTTLLPTLAITVFLILLFIMLTIRRLNKMDIV